MLVCSLAITALVSLVVSAVLSFNSQTIENPKRKKMTKSAATCLLILSFGGLFALLSMALFDANMVKKSTEVTQEIEDTVKLASVSADKTYAGGGVLFVKVTAHNVYDIMCVGQDGGFYKKSIPADSTTIYEVETDFRCETLQQKRITTIDHSLQRFLFSDKEKIQTKVETVLFGTSYRLYIPKGSIVYTYDMQ